MPPLTHASCPVLPTLFVQASLRDHLRLTERRACKARQEAEDHEQRGAVCERHGQVEQGKEGIGDDVDRLYGG